jgi:YHS domain-containing protein
MAKDPVCGVKVNEGHAGGRSEYQGQLYFFCSPDCQQRFDQHPQRYVGQRVADAEGLVQDANELVQDANELVKTAGELVKGAV